MNEQADAPRSGLGSKLRTVLRTVRQGGWSGLGRLLLAKIEGPALHRVLGAVWRRGKRRVRLQGLPVLLDHPRLDDQQRGFWLLHGHEYEGPEVGLINRWLPRDVPVIELGACLGVVGVITNRLLDDPRRHLLVEADPALVPAIEELRDETGSSFTVRNAALAYGAPTVCLRLGRSMFLGSSLHAINQTRAEDTVEVAALSLRELARAAGFERFSLVCDIEGAEHDLATQEGDWLAEHCPVVVAELHSLPQVSAEQACDRLLAAGYELAERVGDVVALRSTRPSAQAVQQGS